MSICICMYNIHGLLVKCVFLGSLDFPVFAASLVTSYHQDPLATEQRERRRAKLTDAKASGKVGFHHVSLEWNG